MADKFKMHVFLFGKGTEHRHIIFAVFIQINRIQVQFHLTAFNARHVQHIVDQGQKMFTRKLRLAEAIKRLGLVVNILDRHIGKANHRIERRADVVRHVEKERTLCLVCKFRLFEVCHFTFGLGIDAMETGNHVILEVFVLDELNLVVNIFATDLQPEVNKVHVFPIHHVENLRRFSRQAERFTVTRMNHRIDKYF